MRKNRWKLDIHPSLHIIFCVLTEVGTSCRFGPFDKKSYTPENYRKLTCPLKRGYFSREYIFEPSILRGMLVFRGVESTPLTLRCCQEPKVPREPPNPVALKLRQDCLYHIISNHIIYYYYSIILYFILLYDIRSHSMILCIMYIRNHTQSYTYMYHKLSMII